VVKVLFIALALFVTSAHAEYSVKYLEHAMFMTVTDGQKLGRLICLDNKTEDKSALPVGWRILTCNNLHTPLNWAICYVNIEKKSFLCGKYTPVGN